ncbi:hypothetical protein H2200_009390 [Cladophialophora chaetospira]|uniref:Uncharacterized protein n=1 Tax=Cladophialophora chaetospira TaxID=386627 RepID=A0AA39CFJ9_9EURO|nr:hypothetical protein H2200_009390 [Cladophialophora chaetospira]
MSTPTLQFSSLRLPDENPAQSGSEEMRFNNKTLEERKIIVRDIISSFDVDKLPSEFKPETYSRITENQRQRPDAERTLDDDFEATCMQWACHDPATWAVLINMQGSGKRAFLFEQKVRRRFDEQFEVYDALPSHGALETAHQMSAKVLGICQQIEAIVEEVRVDIDTRTGGQYNAARLLLKTLGGVCERNQELLPAGSASSTRATLTLYGGLIGRNDSNFVLDALEAAQEKWPNSLATRETDRIMRRIEDLLIQNGAPQEYLTQFQALLSE